MLLIRQSLVYSSLVGGKALKNINVMDSSVQGQVISALVYRRVTYMYQLLSFFTLCGWAGGAILRDTHSIQVLMFRGYFNHFASASDEFQSCFKNYAATGRSKE